MVPSIMENTGITVIEGNYAKLNPLSTDSITEAINRFNTLDYEILRRNFIITSEEKFSKKNIEMNSW